MGRLAQAGIVIGSAIVVGLLGFWIYWGAYFTHVENYELAYIFDSWNNGDITVVGHTGYVKATPIFKSVHTIDLRPTQICISANKRTLNCKLLRFNPKGLSLFLATHGRGNYPITTPNSEGHDATGSLRDILRSYAFDDGGVALPPFVTIVPKGGFDPEIDKHDVKGLENLPKLDNTTPPPAPSAP